jgi:hypothetical protein
MSRATRSSGTATPVKAERRPLGVSASASANTSRSTTGGRARTRLAGSVVCGPRRLRRGPPREGRRQRPGESAGWDGRRGRLDGQDDAQYDGVR